MRRILIEYHPDNASRIALPKPSKESADIGGTLAFHERPVNAAGLFVVRDEEIKEAPRFLASLKYEPAGSKTSSSIRLHGNRLIVEEEQMAIFDQMSTSPPNSR
jgi:hypothetical protein